VTILFSYSLYLFLRKMIMNTSRTRFSSKPLSVFLKFAVIFSVMLFGSFSAASAVGGWRGTGGGSKALNNCLDGKVLSARHWDTFADNVDEEKCDQGSYLNFGRDDERIVGTNLASQKARECYKHRKAPQFRIFWLTEDGSSDEWLYSTQSDTRNEFELAIYRAELSRAGEKTAIRQARDGKHNTIVCVWSRNPAA
jgi:hypothetical protein